jgi:hypothetical protein
MSFNNDGKLTNARPAQPNVGNYVTPAINVHGLQVRDLYSTAPVGQTLPLALHHVSPWELLWKYWNSLVDREWYSALRDFLAILGVKKAETAYLPGEMSKNRFVDRGFGGMNLDVIICWSEWNLVRGPSNRSDDPNQQTQLVNKVDFRGYTKGDTGARLAALVAMADEMLAVFNNPSYPGKESLHSSKIRSWSALARQSLVEFDASMWRIDKNSPPYFNPGGGAVITHPLWRLDRKGQND